MALNGSKEGIIAVLDVGSSKVVCLIAERDSNGEITIKGVGNRACLGVSAGQVTDMALTESAIRQAVDQAEKMAGVTIESVTVGLEGGDPKSEVIDVEVDVDGHAVGEEDIRSVRELARAQINPGEDRQIMHAFPAAYAIDGNYGVKAPIGMYGKKLSVAMLVITALEGPVKNLEMCVRRADMGVERIVIGAYASGLATLVEDEMMMGATCIDMGGGTTSISTFIQGELVHAEVLPIGGKQITEEIARELLTPVDEAERLKNAQGAAIMDGADERTELDIMQVGEGTDSEAFRRMPRSALTGLMQREFEMLLSSVREKLDESGFSGAAGQRVVLTGGLAQSEGIANLASRVLDKKVRIGRPKSYSGTPLSAQNAVFSTGTGLLMYSAKAPIDAGGQKKRRKARGSAPTGTLERMFGWMRGNF